MQLDSVDKAKLFAMLLRFPKETYKGLGRAGATIRSRMRKEMKSEGGIKVPKFYAMDNITQTTSRTGKLGGVLANPSSIQMYKQGKAMMTIGFLSALASYARPFQEEESRPFTQGERIYLRGFGNRLTDGDMYIRPERNLIEPFAKAHEKEFLKWALRNTEKILAKKK